MTINTTTLKANLTTKINNTSGTTDAKEFLLLGKAVEAVSSTGIGSSDIDFGSYKITYSNNYATLSDLPNASTYHGMVAHVHAENALFYSHANAWYELVNYDTSNNVTFKNDVTITGGLTVNGTQTVINSTTLDVDDLNITVAKGAADAAAANGAGISVDGASATFNYANTGDKWTMNKPLDVTGTVTATGVTVNGILDIEEVIEKVFLDTSTATTFNVSLKSEAIRFFTANQTANRTINFRADGSTTLNSIMEIGQSMTCAILMTQGSTPYYLNAYQVDGSSVTPKWSGGTAPSAGNASSIDSYSFTIIKTADATFTVLASLTQYA